MGLIDTDELLNLFAEEFKRTKQLIADGETHLDSLAEGYTEAAHVAKYLAPTVDATPVVRCRDCASFEEIGKYPTNMPEPRGGTSFGYCYHWPYEQGMSPNEVDCNDFCSYGEKKEDENGRT